MEVLTNIVNLLDWTICTVLNISKTVSAANFKAYQFLLELLSSSADILYQYYVDFMLFSDELGSAISSISSAIFNSLSRLIFKINFSICYLFELIGLLYNNTVIALDTAYNSIGIFFDSCLYFSNALYENLLYFIDLFFASIILLLQLPPNIILFTCSLMLYCMKKIFDLATNICIAFSYKTQHIIINIPLKAYCGLILFIIMYYKRNIIKKCIKVSVLSIVNIMLKILYIPFKILKVCFQKMKLLKRKFIFYAITVMNVIKRYFRTIFRIIRRMIFREHNVNREFLCVVCLERPKKIILIPCKHLCLCEICIETIHENNLGCPLCRRFILHTIEVYT